MDAEHFPRPQHGDEGELDPESRCAIPRQIVWVEPVPKNPDLIQRAVARAKAEKKTHTSIQVQRKQSGLPCAMVLTVSFVLSSVTGFLATVAARE
jgi:hypothetical protein